MGWLSRVFSWRHDCDLRASAVQHRPAAILGPVSTLVLYRCRCDRVEVQVVDGRWTLAQVRGEPEPRAEAPAEAA